MLLLLRLGTLIILFIFDLLVRKWGQRETNTRKATGQSVRAEQAMPAKENGLDSSKTKAVVK